LKKHKTVSNKNSDKRIFKRVFPLPVKETRDGCWNLTCYK